MMDFSVNQLHTMENEMKDELNRIFKLVNVSSSADLNQSVLTKLNKAPLATIVQSLVTVVEKNVSLCRNAAVTLD